MKALIQRVSRACVKVGGVPCGEIGRGLLVLFGVMQGDTPADAQQLAAKTARLRVFEDEKGKMNRSLLDIGAQALVVSQFTLCADVKKGNRPSFTPAAPPETASVLYEAYMRALTQTGVMRVERGQFGADMQVELCNDGPVTILLDTDLWKNGGTI